MRTEVDAGRLDGAAVDAVLDAAGHTAAAPGHGGPAGLTAREADVLGLLAQGCSNKAIASPLGISAKTVGNHVEHIYTKLGVTNRAGAAMRAMEYGLVGPRPRGPCRDGRRLLPRHHRRGLHREIDERVAAHVDHDPRERAARERPR